MEATARQERNKQVYRRFVEILNAQDFDRLPDVVDPARYHEDCVGFTPGRVDFPDAIAAYRRVLAGIPDLTARIVDCAAECDRIYARLTAGGTNTGRFFGVPPTRRAYAVNVFDDVQLDGGKIVERAQQSDALSQFRQVYAAAAKKAGAGALVAVGWLVVARPAGRR